MKVSIGGRRKNYSKSSNNNSESSENYKIKKKTVRNTVSAVGTVGVWYTLGGFFITILVVSGILIYMNFLYEKGWIESEAELLEDPNCHTESNNKGRQTESCNYRVKYVVDGKEYTNTVIGRERQNYYFENDKKMIKIVYNPKNPVEVDLKTNRLALNIVLGIILFFAIVLSIVIYRNRNNNIVKGLSTFNMVRSLLFKN